jgi:TPR repeat protein
MKNILETRSLGLLASSLMFALILGTGCGPAPEVQPAARKPELAALEQAFASTNSPANATALAQALLARSASNDLSRAVGLLETAASGGYAPAQNDLGMLYEAGQGVPLDEAKALGWFQKAAQQGLSDAQYSLALMLASGRGTGKDKPGSVHWLRRAAEQGLPIAQFNLAQRYEAGQGTEPDPVEAYRWFQIAAGQGLAEASQSCRALESQLTPADLKRARTLAQSFRPTSAISHQP